MVFISMASIGLPGLNGFVGEMLSLAGMFRRHPVYAVLGATGVVLGAWYLLNMLQHAFFGPLREPAVHEHESIGDMNPREMLAIGPICALCLWIGVMPQPLIDVIRPDVDAVAHCTRWRRMTSKRPSRHASQATPLNYAPHFLP